MSTPSGLRIRPMFATDLRRGFLAALAALKPCDLTEDQAIAVFRQRMKQKIQTYVALVEDRIVGTASLIIEPKFIHSGGVVGHIEDVAVHPDAQHLGIGGLLVDHLLAVCRRSGCYKAILDCDERVIPFYEKHGFTRWEHALRIDLSPTAQP